MNGVHQDVIRIEHIVGQWKTALKNDPRSREFAAEPARGISTARSGRRRLAAPWGRPSNHAGCGRQRAGVPDQPTGRLRFLPLEQARDRKRDPTSRESRRGTALREPRSGAADSADGGRIAVPPS